MVGEARGRVTVEILGDRLHLGNNTGNGWGGRFRGIYRVYDALLIDDGDDASSGCVRWIITNFVYLGFF